MDSNSDLSRRQLLAGVGGVLGAVALMPSIASGEVNSFPAVVASGSQRLTHQSATFSAGNFLLDLTVDSIRVRHRNDPSRSLWEANTDQRFLQVGRGNARFREYGNPLGTFAVGDRVTAKLSVTGLNSVEVVDGQTLNVTGTLSGLRGALNFLFHFYGLSANQLQFRIQIESSNAAEWNRIYLRYRSEPDEGFFGFGHQLTYFNQKGKILPILVQEHGIGRGLPIITPLVDLAYNGAGGTPYLTEAPAPHYITSKLRSLFLENKEYSEFDMGADDNVEISLFANEMVGRIVFGRTPLDLISEYSSYSGRMRAMPDWIHEGVMVAAQESTPGRVSNLIDHLFAANVPVCALWLQDWTGTKSTGAGQQVLWNWQLDRTHYPNWDEMVDRLANRGARVCIYMNPFLVPDLGTKDNPKPSILYNEADSKGYLVKQNGRNFKYVNSTIEAGMIDLSNPEACEWMKQLIRKEMIDNARASGWMADFGEALPFDANLYQDADPHYWHNHYPEAWATLHRDAIDTPDNEGGDRIFWNRSGFSQSPSVSTCFWLGDQLQTWDEYDGIKTAVVGLLSGGVSGFSLLHSDTGGFVAAAPKDIPLIARSKELLMRWMELNAFTAMFRTHEGLIPSVSAQVDDDGQTLAHLARFAYIYKALAPYRKSLVSEASAKGYPVVRHLFLHYPEDRNVVALRYQFMLGAEFLIAPVVDRGATTVRAYLPAGEWTHLWSGSTTSSSEGRWTTVAAPLAQPGVFFRTGSEPAAKLVEALKLGNIL